MRTDERIGIRGHLLVWLLRLAPVALLLAAWWYANGPGDVSALLVPDMAKVGDQLAILFSTSSIWPHVGITLAEFAGAFGLALVLGIGFGFLASRTALRGDTAEPVLAWGYMVPDVLYYPLFILWFDVGFWSKVFFAALAGFFPIAYNTLRGLRTVEARYLRVARAFGASRGQTERLVTVRAALPMVLSGVRLGAAVTMINVILAEMISAQQGLGYQLAMASQTLSIPRSYALIVLLLLVVGVVHLLIQRITPRHHNG
jgi:ABC-type nitrate/sulfonate/bicarbonate transport system permease component